MSNIAIRSQGLSKRYRVGQFVGYKTLRESLVSVFSTSLRRFHSTVAASREESLNPDIGYIWALKDVSFEVKHGEVVGFIGPNGAGKTTLLKILTRITEPTEGYAEIHGRVGSLLEVGTGFHPELTGRENVYLNGAVLGMKKSEIKCRFDEIVAFAEVEKFIDTPLKRYSSGMQVRLAFSVAAHLDPEILLVDEVLAVGDAAFQKKCLGKMGDVAKEGRTILFVSHNMGAIQRLCPRTILIQDGHILIEGESSIVVNEYLSVNYAIAEKTRSLMDLPRDKNTYGKQLIITECSILNSDGGETKTLKLGEIFSVCFKAVFRENLKGVSFILGIDTFGGEIITTVASEEVDELYDYDPCEELSLKVTFKDITLNDGVYSVRVGARNRNGALDLVTSALTFEVTSARYSSALYYRSLRGVIRTTPEWNLVKVVRK